MRTALVGLLRDLRGVAIPCSNPNPNPNPIPNSTPSPSPSHNPNTHPSPNPSPNPSPSPSPSPDQVATACSNRRTYTLFFEWIYPEYTPTLQRACATYYNSPEVTTPLNPNPNPNPNPNSKPNPNPKPNPKQVTTPLLKLYAELVYNKARGRPASYHPFPAT